MNKELSEFGYDKLVKAISNCDEEVKASIIEELSLI